MAITASAKSSGGSSPIPTGLHHAICYGIIDIGTQPSSSPQFRAARKVVFLFEVPDERINIDGKDLPRALSSTYTLSLGDKSKLRPMLESWRGRAFTSEELGGFDITKVLGANAYINVTHAVKGDKTYANITTINPLPKGMQKRVAESKIVEWSVGNQPPGPISIPADMPEWITSKIMLSSEYIDSHMNPAEPTQEASAGDGQSIEDDDVPF